MQPPPRAFLCHASADDSLAERIATALQEAGIDTFLDDWSIEPGQSIRQRIDEGIAGCTHFIVLLTPASTRRKWVNAEIDAGFVQKIRDQAVFVPVRHDLSAEELSPLLASLQSPTLRDSDFDADLRRLIGAIYGLSRKPELGSAPSYTTPVTSRPTGLSPAAERIVSMFAQNSANGRRGDPQLTVKDFETEAGLTIEEIQIAVDELESAGWVEPYHVIGCPPLGYDTVAPLDLLFVQGDRYFMPWNPHDDAVRLAAELVNAEKPSLVTAQTAERLGWPPRRMNPALSVLMHHDAVLASQAINPTFVSGNVRRNNSTARFLRDNS